MSKQQRGRWMLVVLVFGVMGMLLVACVREKPAPERTFTTMDLLIGPSDMPPGWTSLKEFSLGYYGTRDGATRGFVANVGFSLRLARHRVYRYRSARAAKEVYGRVVLPGHWGKTLAEWTYQSPIADQTYFTCYDYEGRTPYPICKWSARYEEYIVIFHSWMVPGYMSLGDMERVVQAIDERMARYLEKPLPTRER